MMSIPSSSPESSRGRTEERDAGSVSLLPELRLPVLRLSMLGPVVLSFSVVSSSCGGLDFNHDCPGEWGEGDFNLLPLQ